MELYLQMGWQMMGHCRELILKWGKGTAIFSPKDQTKEQMQKIADFLHKCGGNVLLDPQLYFPHTNKKPTLLEQDYWPSNYSTGSFLAGSGFRNILDILNDNYIEPMGMSAFILPLLKIDDIDDDWFKISDIIINESTKISTSKKKYGTLCINDNILLNEDKIHQLLEEIEDYPVDGFYIIPMHPGNEYLVDDVSWLINLMDLCASLKLQNKEVITGYSGHQFLLLALAKVNAICAGTWLKTRVFPVNDFNDDDKDEGGRKKPWYYCPQALSEYKIGFLEIARRSGLLDSMKTPSDYESPYADILFSGAQPETVDFGEQSAFRQYLQCLKVQCEEVTQNTYEETLTYLRLIFQTALNLTTDYRTKGVRGNLRDFSIAAEANLSILDAFDNLWGLRYKNAWNKL
ncbi:MAG: hypothetical protein LBM77_01335 [Spirochaetaceae bacterium]|jgi:hypothetical protein|nr:hypothetical protein [Spirochaetaceae bacterium]